MTTTWLLRCGDGGRHVDESVRRGIVAVAFAASDVAGLPAAEIATQLAATKTRTATKRLAEMLFSFANEIDKGDVVITSDRARRQVVVGRVAGPYEWVEADVIPGAHHMRLVDWKARWGWDDLPDPVKNTVLHYQRAVLKFPDQESALALAEAAEASGMPPVFTPPVRKTRGSASDPRLEGASRSERLCTTCFMIRPLSEFDGDALTCRVCG